MANIEEKETSCFDVLRLEEVGEQGPANDKYNSDEFYKIGLIRNPGTTLVFFTPQIPYTWGSLPDDQTGFLCIFKGPFFTEKMKANINKLPMFRAGGEPAYLLTKNQDVVVSGIFNRMLEEFSSDYLYKYDLLRNYVTELIHFALKKNGYDGK